MSPEASSLAAVPGLVRSDSHGPGISRVRDDDGIHYVDPSGVSIAVAALLAPTTD